MPDRNASHHDGHGGRITAEFPIGRGDEKIVGTIIVEDLTRGSSHAERRETMIFHVLFDHSMEPEVIVKLAEGLKRQPRKWLRVIKRWDDEHDGSLKWPDLAAIRDEYWDRFQAALEEAPTCPPGCYPCTAMIMSKHREESDATQLSVAPVCHCPVEPGHATSA